MQECINSKTGYLTELGAKRCVDNAAQAFDTSLQGRDPSQKFYATFTFKMKAGNTKIGYYYLEGTTLLVKHGYEYKYVEKVKARLDWYASGE